ncbi:MAG TPA: PQQ-binding-like beta-propeller repeat protein [Candidatus Bathyarchaeia archaeon]|nr:PQQ-binding-like beta-propeller repeat protein [Candidatus Bathyarchaeia archaeon]
MLALSIVTILTSGIIPARNASTPMSIVSISPSGSTDYPWTMFHYDAARDGATPAAGPASAAPMWTFTTGNIVYPSPVVVDGYVFITSYDGTLYALDQYTGSLLWAFPTSGNIIGSPAVYQGMVFLSSKNGYVYALNEQTGALVWEIANDNLTPVTSSPVVADGLLFYGTFEAPSAGFSELLAVNPQDGTVVWKYDIPSEYVEGSASVSNGRVFVGAGVPNPAIVLALNDTTGKLLWSYNTANATSISTAPVIAYGRVFVGLDNFRFFALDENTGSLDWSFNTPGGSNATTPAVYNGVVYFGTGARVVYALNATTGTQIWTRTTGGAVTSSPTVAIGSNELFVGSNDRYLYTLSLSTGAVLWRYLAGGQVSSSPAVANGRVFFGAKDHKVYALGATAPRLHDSISSNSTTLQSGQVAALSIKVTNGTFPITGASVTLSSSQGGTFSSIVDLGSGNYAANYTAPTVGSRVGTTIQVTSSYSGYLSATNQTVIALNPLPTLTVTVSPKPSAITPGGDVLLMIRVTNASLLITGATLSFSSSGGGSFSSILDSGNGNYTAVFSTPLQSSVPVVTVQAAKMGFTSGQGQTTVQVNGVPNLTTLKVAGVPFFLVIATSVVLFLLMLAVIVQKKKTGPQAGLPPEPSFTY